MDFYCILHVSDLHIAPNSEAIRLYSCHHDLAARLYEKLPFSSRFDPSILESILNHANYWAKSLDAILITGDLSSKGRQDDLEKTVDFIQKLEKLGKPVFVLPGNHDRYNWVVYRFIKTFTINILMRFQTFSIGEQPAMHLSLQCQA